MADAERIDETVERDRAPRLDRREEIAGARLAQAFPVLERFRPRVVARLEGEDVGGLADRQLLVIEELLDLLLAEALDVEGAARDEMAAAARSSGTGQTNRRCSGAPTPSLPVRGRLAHRVAAAGAGQIVGNS